MPSRKKPIARGEGPRRTGRLKPMSDKKRAALPDEREVREAVFKRDGYRCRLGTIEQHDCVRSLSVHHLLKASAGGFYEPANLVTLCIVANDWVEDHPVIAHGFGLVIGNGETEEMAWALLVATGLVSYGPLGEPTAPRENPISCT